MPRHVHGECLHLVAIWSSHVWEWLKLRLTCLFSLDCSHLLKLFERLLVLETTASLSSYINYTLLLILRHL